MAARYADYVADLRTLFCELDRHPDLFQTFDVRLELAAAGGLGTAPDEARAFATAAGA